DGATVRNHNVYIQYGNANVTFRRNISTSASSHGCQARSGGLIEDNLFLGNPINLLVATTVDEDVMNCGIGATVRDNVILEGADIEEINQTRLRGWGLEINHACEAEAYGNLIAHQTRGGGARGVYYKDDLKDVAITGNIV